MIPRATGRPESRPSEQRDANIRKVTLTGVAVNAALVLGQLATGLLTGSQALLADAIHTLSDLLTDGLVLIFSRAAHAPPDASHPYGHGRFEALGTMLLSAVLAVTGLGLAFHAVLSFEAPTPPQAPALVLALAGVAAKEALYQLTHRAARRLRSSLLEANAWHHRSDAISSIASSLGIAGALLGFPILDPVAAAIVGLIILKVALGIGWGALQELLDAALEAELLDAVRREVKRAEEVRGVHAVRARRMGPQVLIDLHMEVPGSMTVLEAHAVSERVEARILERFDEVSEVLIHIDPAEESNPEHRRREGFEP